MYKEACNGKWIFNAGLKINYGLKSVTNISAGKVISLELSGN